VPHVFLELKKEEIMTIKVDLYSDTQSRPTDEMRNYMLGAEVGDEQRSEDPTTNRLIENVTTLLGKEAAIFLPSGTMCNEIAYRVHCAPGDEIILDKTSHALHYEVGAPSALAGAMTTSIDGENGVFNADQVRAAIRPISRHMPRTRLLSVENTANLGGGTIWPLDQINEVAAAAHEFGLKTHLDGARLLNAAVGSGNSAKEFAASYDSVWIDLTKGLGAPVGAVLAGSESFIDQAWRFKHQFGGAMRQSGIIAAAGIYALEHNVDRLAEDHKNAQLLARNISKIAHIELLPNEPETNMVFFNVESIGLTAAEVATKLLNQGVRIGVFSEFTLRAVTYLDVSAEDIEIASAAIRKVLA
jgi:threonine aldolase